MRGCVANAGLATALIASLCATQAAAQSTELRAAQLAFENADFEHASVGFEATLRARAARRDELAVAHGYLAAIALGAGETARAERDLELALALDPGWLPPAGASPALATLRTAIVARRRGARAHLTLALPSAPLRDSAATVRVTVAALPPGASWRVATRCEADARPVGASDVALGNGPTEGIEVPLAPLHGGTLLRCEATLGTDAGAALDRAASTAVLGGVLQPRHDDGRSGGQSNTAWAVLGVGGGVLLVGGVVAAVLAATAAGGAHQAQFGAPHLVP